MTTTNEIEVDRLLREMGVSADDAGHIQGALHEYDTSTEDSYDPMYLVKVIEMVWNKAVERCSDEVLNNVGTASLCSGELLSVVAEEMLYLKKR